MVVPQIGVTHSLARMAVKMQVDGAIGMAMTMQMDLVLPEPPQHMRAKPDQHDADGCFDRLRHMFRNRTAEHDGRAGKGKQGQRMAEAPGEPMLDNIADVGAAGGDGRYGCNMIRLERMMQAEDEAESENSKQTPPVRLTAAFSRQPGEGASHPGDDRTSPAKRIFRKAPGLAADLGRNAKILAARGQLCYSTAAKTLSVWPV